MGATAQNSHESIQHFSLMNALLAVINTSSHDATDAVLARYFLEHFDTIGSLNVYEVAEACYTTRSGIRRFCQSIGLDNFSDLKSYAWEWARHRQVFCGYASHPGYRVYHTYSIERTLHQVDELVSEQLLDELAGTLHDAARSSFLVADFSASAVRQFQQSMLYLHKLIAIVTDSGGDISQVGSLGPKDALFVVSEHGNYARAAMPLLSALGAQTTLVTHDAPQEVAEAFDLAVYLSHDEPIDGRTVFASFGLPYFLDLLYNRYFELFAA